MIGLPLATALGLAAIIGAGIFVLSGTAIAIAGSYAIVAFVLVGIVALIVALEFGELCSMFPNLRGASYSYVYEAFGSELSFITGIIIFFSGATSISVVALGFGSYLATLIGPGAAAYVMPVAIALIAVIAIVNILGAKKAAEADLGLVITKILILMLFIGFAMYFALGTGHFAVTNFAMPGSKIGITVIFSASIAIFFAYSGFGTISTLTAEVRGGSRTAVKAMVLAVMISLVLYTTIVFSLMLLAPASSYKIAADPFAFALSSAGAPSWLSVAIDIGAMVATASAAVAMMLSASRTVYQMGADGLLPSITKKFNKDTDSAVNGVIISSVIAFFMLFAGNIFVIAAVSSFGLLFAYLMVSLAVIHFRRTKRAAAFRMPLYPYLTVVAIVILLAFMTGIPREALIVGVILIIVLLGTYYLLREMRFKRVIRIRIFK